MESFIKDFSVNVTKFAGNCGLVTFVKEIIIGKLTFLCSEIQEAIVT